MINFYLPSTDLPEKQWRISLVLAIALHLLVLGVAYVAPYIFQFRSPLPEVYTVNLFTVEEARAPALAAPKAKAAPPSEEKTVKEPTRTAPPPKPEPKPEAKPEPKAEPVAVEEAASSEVSLKPIKTKSKTDLEKVKKLRNRLLAKDEAKKAEKEAAKTAKDALEKLKDSLYTQSRISRIDTPGPAASGPPAAQEGAQEGVQGGAPAGGGSGGEIVDEILRRYLLAITNQIQEYWQIPLYQNWEKDLEVRVILTVRRDGTVAKTEFEHKSSNIYFNQFVEKTIKNATPLPPFPVGINDEQMDIGLRFTLQGLL